MGLDGSRLSIGRGCGECGRTGYKGRLAIHEVLPLDGGLRSLILQKRPDHEYAAYAAERGMVTLLQDGLRKAAEGQTTLTEVFRVTGRDD
ncbi:putative type II secretion system protein E [compost metagenome]